MINKTKTLSTKAGCSQIKRLCRNTPGWLVFKSWTFWRTGI